MKTLHPSAQNLGSCPMKRKKQQSPSSSLRTDLAKLIISAGYSDLIGVAGEFSDRIAEWDGDGIPLRNNENWATFLYTWAEMVRDEE